MVARPRQSWFKADRLFGRFRFQAGEHVHKLISKPNVIRAPHVYDIYVLAKKYPHRAITKPAIVAPAYPFPALPLLDEVICHAEQLGELRRCIAVPAWRLRLSRARET